MGFSTSRFKKQKFLSRTESVTVNALRTWFDDVSEDDDCLWEVRGLTGHEFATVLQCADKTKTLTDVVEAISNGSSKEELKEVLGLGTDTPIDLAKRLEQLVLGSVNPVIESDVAVNLAEKFPVEFYILTNKITELTGLGMDIKK